MESIPWYAWIAMLVIASRAVIMILAHKNDPAHKENKDLGDALQANTEASLAVSKRLDVIEQRMSNVENTLTDIP